MFTNHDRAKELAIYTANQPETEFFLETTPEFLPDGVATVKTFLYKNPAANIKYNKWIVENAEMAQSMKLPGSEKHNQIVKGSAVRVLHKRMNNIFNFYGKEAMEIVNACEINNIYEIQKLTNNLQR